MTITMHGSAQGFRDQVEEVTYNTSGLLTSQGYTDGTVTAMHAGIYGKTPVAGWAYFADIRKLPANGVVTELVLGELLTAAGGWQFDDFVDDVAADKFWLGYLYNAINKALWSAQNNWTPTLQLRLAADNWAGDEASNGQLAGQGFGLGAMYVDSQSGKSSNHEIGFFPWGGCTGADPKNGVYDVFMTSAWSQFEDHVEAERGRRAARKLVS